MPLSDIKKVYPDGYDDKTTAMGKPKNREVFTLASGIDVSSTSITLNEDVSGIELPTLLLFGGGEIWYLEVGDIATPGPTYEISINYSQKAQLGTQTQIHTLGEEVFTYFSGVQHTVIRNILISKEKFPLVKDQQRAAALVGEAYVEESTKDIYASFDGANYIQLSSGKHTNLDDIGTATKVHGDQYLNVNILSSWHSAIAGSHITDGDDHTHLVDASPVRRVVAGSFLPTATKVGQVYLLDGDLYISFDGSTWDEFFGTPQASITVFPPSAGCPAGWSEYTALNNAYAKVVTGGTGTKSGANIHTHSIQEIPEHTHTVLSESITTSQVGGHAHTYPSQGGGGIKNVIATATSATNTAGAGGSGDHSHTATAPEAVTDGLLSGNLVASITSDSESSEPPYATVTWCKKD